MPYLGKQKNLLPSTQVSSFMADKKSQSASVNSGNGLELISSGTSTGTVTFSDLSNKPYQHLLLISCVNLGGTAESRMRIRFNGSGAGYSTLKNSRTTTAASTNEHKSITAGIEYYVYHTSDSGNADQPAMIWVYNYKNTSINKQVKIISGCVSANNIDSNGVITGTGIIYLATGAWENTAAIDSLEISNPFTALDVHEYQLYGLRG